MGWGGGVRLLVGGKVVHDGLRTVLVGTAAAAVVTSGLVGVMVVVMVYGGGLGRGRGAGGGGGGVAGGVGGGVGGGRW